MYGPTPVRKGFFDNLEKLDLSSGLAVDCPVSIVHGVRDDAVPHLDSLRIMDKLRTDRVDLVSRG